MYNHFQLAKKYLRYYFTASNGKGHGVHSPFVFAFIKNVLNDKKEYSCYNKIESRRSALQAGTSVIEVEDFGAGSTVIKSKQRVVRDIANSSLKPRKFAQLLFRIVHYYKPNIVLELGTSMGITTSYLACGNEAAKIYTCEGSASIAAIAQTTFNELQLKNIELVPCDFTNTLPPLLSAIGKVDLAFIDGNHRRKPTLAYFKQLLTHSSATSILIFDDIHWSKEMELAWLEIQEHPAVTGTVDLFFIGLVFVNPDFKVKQHYTIRF